MRQSRLVLLVSAMVKKVGEEVGRRNVVQCRSEGMIASSLVRLTCGLHRCKRAVSVRCHFALYRPQGLCPSARLTPPFLLH